MKKIYIFLYIILLVVGFSCQKEKLKDDFSENQDSTIVQVDSYTSFDESLVDSLKRAKAKQLQAWQQRISNEKFRFKTKPISEKWLKNVQKFNKDSLPSKVASYFYPVLLPTTQDAISTDNPKIEYFEILNGNLDEDDEPEKVIYFQYWCELADACHSILLDKKNGNWYIMAEVIHFSRHTVKAELDTVHKLLIAKSGYWGSSHNGEEIYLYEYKADTLHKIFSYPKMIFFGMSHYGLSESLEGQHEFISENEIQLTCSYNLFQMLHEKMENNIIPQLDILKDKKMIFSLKKNNKNGEFEPVDSTLSNHLGINLLTISFEKYEKEAIYLSQYGTKEQKKALEIFSMARKEQLK